jgi:predicted metal-dependent RNase
LEAQKSKIESLENQLKALEQKQLASDNENKLLEQENQVFKLKYHMDTKDQEVMKEDIIQQLAEAFSKMIALRVDPDVLKNSNADEDNPENDICYDE